MAPYCKQYRAIPVWMKYWSSLSNTRAIPQFFVTGNETSTKLGSHSFALLIHEIKGGGRMIESFPEVFYG